MNKTPSIGPLSVDTPLLWYHKTEKDAIVFQFLVQRDIRENCRRLGNRNGTANLIKYFIPDTRNILYLFNRMKRPVFFTIFYNPLG